MNLVRRPRPASSSTPCCEGNTLKPQTAAGDLRAAQISLLVDAACAARLGASNMTLSDWRDVEEEVKQKLQNTQYQQRNLK